MHGISRWLERWIDLWINWKMVIALFLLPVIAIRLFVPPALHDIVWGSILNAQAFMFYWTELGYAAWLAFAVGVSCGSYCLFFWWGPFIICLRKSFRKRTDLPRRYRGFRNYVDHSGWSLLWKARDAGEKVYYFFVPRRCDGLDPNDYHVYLPLLWYFGMPGNEWTGICYALDRKLYAVTVIPLMAVMNALKIVVFGELGVWLVHFSIFHQHHAVLIIGIVTVPFFNKRVEEWMRRRTFTEAEVIETPSP